MAQARVQSPKDFPDRTVLEALTPAALAGLISPAAWRRFAAVYRLKNRDLQVAKEMCADSTRGSMARKLSCSPGSVRDYIDSLFRKAQGADRKRLDRMRLLIRVFGFLLADLLEPANSGPSEGRSSGSEKFRTKMRSKPGEEGYNREV